MLPLQTKKRRGYFGIGIENGKTCHNLGTLFRSAHALGAGFIFAIGQRYKLQNSDTSKAYKSVPFFEYRDVDEMYDNIPRDCRLIGVEYPLVGAHVLTNFVHPERCIYLLGSEDHGLSNRAKELIHLGVYIPTNGCLNVASAGSIILYDRMSKQNT